MADKKISALTGATTPLAGTEVLPIVQGGSTVKVSVANLTAGRTVSVSALGVGTASPLTAINLEGGSFLLRGGVMDMGPVAGADGAGRISTVRGGDGVSGILAFSTQNPSAAIVEAMRIDGSGNVTNTIGNLVIGTANKGIDFSANTNAPGMTSELLDWYEEGTWAIADVSGAGLSLTVDHAKYTRVGNLVTINAYVTYPATANVSAATLSLPFSAAAYDLGSAGASNGAVFSIITTGGTNAMSLRSSSLVSLTNAAVSGANVLMSFTYMV